MFGSNRAAEPVCSTDEPVPVAERAGDYLLATQTLRQQELGRRIYERLKAGAEVDDVRDLVEEFGRVATDDVRQRRRAGGPQGGVVR